MGVYQVQATRQTLIRTGSSSSLFNFDMAILLFGMEVDDFRGDELEALPADDVDSRRVELLLPNTDGPP